MALLTGDSENYLGLVEAVGWRRKRFEVCAMALQATRNDGFIEVRKTVGIAGTIDPSIGFRPVRNGEFEEFLSFPIQVGLSLAPGADHEVETLPMSDGLGWRQFRESGLEIAFLRGTHDKK
jgi:hypothetical protein